MNSRTAAVVANALLLLKIESPALFRAVLGSSSHFAFHAMRRR